MKKLSIEAIILRSINQKDADKLYTAYSPTLGKFTFLAKGVRKISSKRKGSLDTLNYVHISLAEDTNGYRYLNEVVLKESFKDIKANYEKTRTAYYFIEIILRHTEEGGTDSNYIFKVLFDSLKLLNMGHRKNISLETVKIFYLLCLTKYLGYELNFSKCSLCGTAYDPSWSFPSASLVQGGLLCPDCASQFFSTKLTHADVSFASSVLDHRLNLTILPTKEFANFISLFAAEHLGEDLKTLKYLS